MNTHCTVATQFPQEMEYLDQVYHKSFLTSVCSRRSNFSIMADIKLFEEKNLSITTTFLLLENKVFSINSRIIFYFFENSRELNVYSLIYFYYIISPLMRYFADCFYNLVRLLSVGSPC